MTRSTGSPRSSPRAAAARSETLRPRGDRFGRVAFHQPKPLAHDPRIVARHPCRVAKPRAGLGRIRHPEVLVRLTPVSHRSESLALLEREGQVGLTDGRDLN